MSDNNDRVQMIEQAEAGIRVLSAELTRLSHQSEQAEYARKQMEDVAGRLQSLHDQLEQTIVSAAERGGTALQQTEEAGAKIHAVQEQLGQTASVASEQLAAQLQQLQTTINGAEALVGSQQAQLEADRLALQHAAQEMTNATPALAQRIAAGLTALQDGVDKRLSETRGQLAAALNEHSQNTVFSIGEVSSRAGHARGWAIVAVLLSLIAAGASCATLAMLLMKKL
jgi:chromosome segregation ATPase